MAIHHEKVFKLKRGKVRGPGRPRKEPTIPDDVGTPELRIKKASVAVGADDGKWWEESESPISFLLARGWCDVAEYAAAERFGRTWGKLFGRGFGKNLLATLVPGSFGGSWTEQEIIEAEGELALIRSRLESRGDYDALLNCVIYHRISDRTLGRLKRALVVLVEVGKEMRRAA